MVCCSHKRPNLHGDIHKTWSKWSLLFSNATSLACPNLKICRRQIRYDSKYEFCLWPKKDIVEKKKNVKVIKTQDYVKKDK